MAKPDAVKILLKILKYAWIPLLLVFAFFIGAYIGYGFLSDSSGSDVFSLETWQNFIGQIKSLRPE